MRIIPASIQEKIRKACQTQAENADPKINIVLQRTKRYIAQGTELQPRDLWTKANLGALDITYRREDKLKAPEWVYLAFIQDGVVHLTRQEYIKSIEEINEWQYQGIAGPAVDVALEFDGRWHRASEDAEICFDSPALWTLTTFGEPWIFRVTAAGALTAQQGYAGTAIVLADTGVTRVSAIRGWKNTYLWNHDQGLVVAYIKNGKPYYRNYAQQPPDMPAIWEEERQITELPATAQKITTFRTNDYRTGIAVESNGEIHWAITTRNWSTMALEPHTITAAVSVTAELIKLARTAAYTDHIITAAVSPKGCLSPAIWPQVVQIHNPGIDDTETILIESDLPLYGDLTGLQAAFTVKDSIGTTFAVTATSKGTTDNIIKLTTATFEGASGDLTVTYDYTKGAIAHLAEGGCMMELSSFAIPFTPLVQPPEGYTTHTVTAAVNVTADFISVDHVNCHTDHTITAAISVTAQLIPVSELPP